MQIHELNNYSGSLGDAYLVADNGSDTGKIKTTALTDPLNARIDNIIAGPSSSAAEVIDARLGADGATYSTLGAAIRTQIGDLIKFGNISINSNRLTNGTWSNGSIAPDNRRLCIKSLIPVKKGTVIIFDSKELYCAFGMYADDSTTDVDYTGWINGKGRYVCPIDGNLFMQFANGRTWSTSTPIQVNQYDCIVYAMDNEVVNHIIEQLPYIYTEGDVQQGGWENGYPTDSNVRIRIKTKTFANKGDAIRIKPNGLWYALNVLSDETSSTVIFDSGWSDDDLVYKFDTNCVFTLAFANGGSYSQSTPIVPTDYNCDVKLFKGYLSDIISEIDSLTPPNYEYNGGFMFGKNIKYNCIKTEISGGSEPPGTFSHQGFAICNDVYFQLFSNDKITLLDLNTAESVTLDITSEHGNSISFSDQYYDAIDEFPLCYITADSNPQKVYVNRITRTASTLIATYALPLDKSGYYADGAIDKFNHRFVSLGYTNESYSVDDGDNRMLLCVWDFDDYTLDDSGNRIPKLIQESKIPFLKTHQGCTFFDGCLWVVSSHSQNPSTEVWQIDPLKGVQNILTEFPSAIKGTETEGCCWYAINDKYELYLKRNANNDYLYKLTFNN